MAELLPTEKLQPALLDRLADDSPDERREPREARVMSMRRLRECVVRDITWLLGSACSPGVAQRRDAWPQCAASVLDYGLPVLAGRALRRDDVAALERAVRDALVTFEPRLVAHSIEVRVELDDSRMSHNRLRFDIEAQLWAQPVPEHLFLKTELDLETGNVSIDGV